MSPDSSTTSSERAAPRARRRIGLYGGSFDPVHLGHLHVASSALAALDLDEVRFLPAPQAPHKRGRIALPIERRVALLRLALADQPRFAIEDHEIRRGGAGYTYDTLTELAARYGPGVDLVFLIGGDSLRDLPKWHRAADLVREFTLATVPRDPGVDVAALTAPVRAALGSAAADQLAAHVLNVVPLPISSTEIRARCARGGSLAGLVPPAVERELRAGGDYASH